MAVNELSFATTPVVALSGEEPRWQGTGFFYMVKRDDNTFIYLVTNEHILTGGYQVQGNGEPPVDHVVFQFHKSTEQLDDVTPVRMPLYTRQGHPVWLKSETTPAADLAAILVPGGICEGLALRCLDQKAANVGQAPTEPLTAVHALGFPYGCHDQANSLPLWLTGALTSDPGADFDGEPSMGVDFPPYPGLSGAPVFTMSEYRPPAAGASVARPVSVRRFLGIYASPPLSDGAGYPELLCAVAHPATVARDTGYLGRIWRAEVIEELLANVDTERWRQEIWQNLA